MLQVDAKTLSYIDGALRFSTLPNQPRGRRRLYQFHSNVRPPFYGTLAAAAAPAVRGRRPLARDSTLDYEVDSDDEWEEDPGGEDVQVSDGEDDEEEVDEEEEDGFMVPDGYLSDDELRAVAMDADDGGGAPAAGPVGEADGEADPAELERAKTIKQLEMQARTCERHNRVLILCRDDPRSSCKDDAGRFLGAFVLDVLEPELLAAYAADCREGPRAPGPAAAAGGSGERPTRKPKKPQHFPEELVPELIRHLLGPIAAKIKNTDTCVGTFLTEHPRTGLSRRVVKEKILCIATKEKSGWCVREELLAQHGIEAPGFKTPLDQGIAGEQGLPTTDEGPKDEKKRRKKAVKRQIDVEEGGAPSASPKRARAGDEREAAAPPGPGSASKAAKAARDAMPASKGMKKIDTFFSSSAGAGAGAGPAAAAGDSSAHKKFSPFVDLTAAADGDA